MTTDEHSPTGFPTTLVIGGTGKSGRRVAARLAGRGVAVRTASRSSRPPFSWQDESTWAPALHGVGAAYLSYHPDIGLPQAAEQIGSFVELALAEGVGRLVLLSGRGSDAALRAERALQDSKAAWTVVRSSWFSQNFSEGFLTELVRGGRIAFPAGGVAEPFVDADDVADVVVAALTDDRHVHQVYELTGPSSLTFADVAAELTRAAGRPVRYEPISFEEFVDALSDSGVPAEAAAATASVFREILDGRNTGTTNGVQHALGRPAAGFTDYARAAAASGVWRA